MCGEEALVPIPDLLWDAGAIHNFDAGHPEYGIDGEGRRCLRLDACIVPVVQKLWDQGVVTLSCCCGHGDPWGVITIQTQPGVGQRGAMVMRVERYDELLAAESDLAAANATIAAQSLALATLREALAEISGGAIETLDLTDRLYTNGRVADGVQIEFETHGPAKRIREIKALLAQPADDAAALAGAVLAAADAMAEAIRTGVRELPRGGMTGGGDPPYSETWRMFRQSLDAYCRARSALRGGGITASGEDGQA